MRVLFEKAQNGGKTHYQDCDVTSEKEADKRLVRLDLPKREVRLWTSGSPCMRACDLGHAAASKEKPLDPSRGFGASAEAAARAAQKKDFTYQGKGSEGLAKAEQEAKTRLSSKPSQDDVEACLKLLGDSWPTQERPNVTPDGKAARISASRRVEAPSRHLHESSPGMMDVGGFFVDFDAPRRSRACVWGPSLS